jgi:hypothetical protein
LPSLVPIEETTKDLEERPFDPPRSQEQNAGTIGKSPGEIAFFKLLHTEFKKVTHFFERSSEQYAIREERVREGMNIMKQPNSIMVNEKWSLMAKSVHRLYKDLLLLETFAIMSYCSFSKILKKHDKVTGYNTRNAFMENVVNKANFTHYPKLLEMITRCERMHEEVSSILLTEGKESLYEDERLFINMISRLNEQVLTGEDDRIQKESSPRRLSLSLVKRKETSQVVTSSATSTLQSILQDTKIAKQSESCDDKESVRVAEEESSDESDSPTSTQKRTATEGLEVSDAASKRQRTI